jgi:hypothetical protein
MLVTISLLERYCSMVIIVSFIQLPTFHKKYSPAKYNYEIYDKELIAIIDTFEAWRPEL